MKLSAKRAFEIVSAFPQARIAVVGDFIADVYVRARPERLSREAPVMVVQWESESTIPGGAANAINNLVALGAEVHPVGILGDDAAGVMLREFFEDRVGRLDGIVVRPGVATVAKTRVMVGEEGRSRQQILRIDREPGVRAVAADRAAVAERLRELLPSLDAVLFSDYGYGLVGEEVLSVVRSAGPSVVVTADSRYHLRGFHGVDLVTPNHSETEDLVGHPVRTDDETARAGDALLRELGVGAVLVTRGNRGMMLFEAEEPPRDIPAAGRTDEVTDVSGAGDTVISLATLGLVAGATRHEAAQLANFGASVVVTRLGAATLSREELLRAVTAEE